MAGGSDGKVYTKASSRETEDLHKVPTARHLSYHLPPTQPVILPSIRYCPACENMDREAFSNIGSQFGGTSVGYKNTSAYAGANSRPYTSMIAGNGKSHTSLVTPCPTKLALTLWKETFAFQLIHISNRDRQQELFQAVAKAVSPQHRRTSTQNYADKCLHSGSRQVRPFGRGEPTTTNWPGCSSIATTRFWHHLTLHAGDETCFDSTTHQQVPKLTFPP
jgi:hypothetical protein